MAMLSASHHIQSVNAAMTALSAGMLRPARPGEPFLELLSGLAPETDAGGAMSGGNYSVTGGFWSLFAVQTPGAPLLSISCVGNQAVVSWDPSVTGWTLQTNANLAAPAWGNYAGPVSNNRVTNSPPSGNLFFRLKQ